MPLGTEPPNHPYISTSEKFMTTHTRFGLLEGIDPYGTANRDNTGKRIYDLVVNTCKINAKETAGVIYDYLAKKGYLIEKGKNKNPLPPEGTVYQKGQDLP